VAVRIKEEHVVSQAQSPEPRKIIAETRLIPGGATDVKLQLINKRPDDLRRFLPERTLVMMNVPYVEWLVVETFWNG
jgi:hypothetical protein